MIRSNQGLPESPSQESVMFRVEKETTKYFFFARKSRNCRYFSPKFYFLNHTIPSVKPHLIFSDMTLTWNQF